MNNNGKMEDDLNLKTVLGFLVRENLEPDLNNTDNRWSSCLIRTRILEFVIMDTNGVIENCWEDEIKKFQHFLVATI